VTEPKSPTPTLRLTLKMCGYAAARLLAVLVLGLLIGLIFDHVTGFAFAAVLLYAAWQLLKLFRLDHWLRHRSLMDPPVLGGIWDDVVTQIVRIHRRKRYHKSQLVQLLRELRDSTAAVPDGVVVLNPRREIVWFNRMAAQLMELRRRKDFGIRIENLIRQPEFARYLHGGRYATPIVLRTAVSPERHLSFHVLPYGRGQLLLLARDVTRQMRLEALRKDFVANASHELRSPLTVISGYLETLSSDPILQEIEAPLQEMRRQAERMTAIIHDLLELSRLESNEDEVEGEAVDISALIVMLRKDVLARPQHPAEIVLRIESDLHLLGTPAEIHSAFSNLVDNASKYTPESGRVELRWWTDEDGGHLAVTDTGIGIPSEHIHRLTERFYRVDAGRSRATGGSGLGLAIVKHVLQRHGGTLEIASVEGRGSTFTCHFPPRRLVRAGAPLPADA
jgi:two-component system, OmpR family, phosphate regulon sensor histidine kinase PhoR